MFNIFSLIQEIFFGKEVNATQVGLSCFKDATQIEQPKQKRVTKDIKISELMKKSV